MNSINCDLQVQILIQYSNITDPPQFLVPMKYIFATACVSTIANECSKRIENFELRQFANDFCSAGWGRVGVFGARGFPQSWRCSRATK